MEEIVKVIAGKWKKREGLFWQMEDNGENSLGGWVFSSTNIHQRQSKRSPAVEKEFASSRKCRRKTRAWRGKSPNNHGISYSCEHSVIHTSASPGSGSSAGCSEAVNLSIPHCVHLQPPANAHALTTASSQIKS
ncbi:hypothetical protein KSP40_PGU008518 [Platanthera guangdongensis]|uniref:Uncharacterized protein n=1 Tax=Platanthera guangdongensis TaxID=2320717 RepID=A0ABR2LEL5_9ASPA